MAALSLSEATTGRGGCSTWSVPWQKVPLESRRVENLDGRDTDVLEVAVY